MKSFTPVEDRLEASLRHDVINGDSHERAVLERQISDAIAEIKRLREGSNTTKRKYYIIETRYMNMNNEWTPWLTYGKSFASTEQEQIEMLDEVHNYVPSWQTRTVVLLRED